MRGYPSAPYMSLNASFSKEDLFTVGMKLTTSAKILSWLWIGPLQVKQIDCSKAKLAG